MIVIFDRRHVMCKLPARLVTGLYWMVAVLSSVDALLAVELALAH